MKKERELGVGEPRRPGAETPRFSTRSAHALYSTTMMVIVFNLSIESFGVIIRRKRIFCSLEILVAFESNKCYRTLKLWIEILDLKNCAEYLHMQQNTQIRDNDPTTTAILGKVYRTYSTPTNLPR